MAIDSDIRSRLSGIGSFALASEAFGGWGATIVHLTPKIVENEN